MSMDKWSALEAQAEQGCSEQWLQFSFLLIIYIYLYPEWCCAHSWFFSAEFFPPTPPCFLLFALRGCPLSYLPNPGASSLYKIRNSLSHRGQARQSPSIYVPRCLEPACVSSLVAQSLGVPRGPSQLALLVFLQGCHPLQFLQSFP